ncbi:MAG: flagellar hook-basal body complex protein [Sphingobium sp.]|nr:flagellar hook-basal body complex protein [Sphingobium sp.]
MSFYISLSGLKGAQGDLAAIANNVANVGSTAFKKSKVSFGDIFAGSPMSANTAGGQGTRQIGATQQFTQGTLETTGKTLDIALTGEGFMTVKSAPPASAISFTRNGAFGVDQNRYAVDTLGNRVQVMPVDPATGKPSSTDPADFTDLRIPEYKEDATGNPVLDAGGNKIQLASVGVSVEGVISTTWADGTTDTLGNLAIASFPSQEGLRQMGDGHWQTTKESGQPTFGAGNNGLFGAVRSGMLERSNVDITEELVALIAAQRNFQANAKAIEASSTITQAITNLRT